MDGPLPASEAAPMSRGLRILDPGAFWFVTDRCVDARFLLRPDRELTELAGFCLARAARRFEGISIHGVMFMSNHLHLIVCDRDGELSDFMCAFNGVFAKAVNGLRGRRGHVFERRFSSERILDEEAKVERLVYLALNPVKADLVERHGDWPGLSLRSLSGELEQHPFRHFNECKFKIARQRAIRDGVALPQRSDYEDEETLTVHALLPEAPAGERQATARMIEEELRRREAQRRQERARRGLRVLGVRRVLDQNPGHVPADPKRSPRPLCHTGSLGLWSAFRALMKLIHRAYAAASLAFRAGEFETEFPRYSFRPPGRSVSGAAGEAGAGESEDGESQQQPFTATAGIGGHTAAAGGCHVDRRRARLGSGIGRDCQ